MRGKIKKYSGRTGKGIFEGIKGEIVSFNYKQLHNCTAIPINTVVNFSNGVLKQTGYWGSFMYYITKERSWL